MSLFAVKFDVTLTYLVEIEAESADDASEVAWQEYGDFTPDRAEVTVISVEAIS